ncbi:MAG: 30S ribosomal protein S19 [bacterium]|nr:30S ribosomal protein S19 [bacterium]
MPRSIKKGPYVDANLQKRIQQMNNRNEKRVVKTWARRSMVIPDFVGHTLAIHNGNKFIPVYISENMVGHKLGEFAPTRIFRGHAGKATAEKTAVKAAAPAAAPASKSA